MKYATLLRESTQQRCGYLHNVLQAAVSEGREGSKPVGIAIAETLAAFSLSDDERDALQREAVERLRHV